MAFIIYYLYLARYGFYLILWHLFEYCKNVYRTYKGTNKIPLNKARIHKILFRHIRSPAEVTRREDFVTIDDGFVSIDELTGPKWTIYSLDKKSALFVEMPEPISHYSIDKCPFIYPHLFEESLRVAEIDLKTFLEFGEKLELHNKPPKCLFFTNTARSASTLFGSMLHHDGHSTVFGEHPSLTTIAIGYCQRYWNEKDVALLLKSTIKLLRCHFPPNHLVIFKTRSMETFLVPFLAKLFPEMSHIFMFRKNGLNSVEKMLAFGDSFYLALCKMYIYFPTITKFLTSLVWKTIGEMKPKSDKEAAMIFYAEPYFNYKKNQHLYDFPVVWQHDLIGNTETVLAPIFAKLGIPASCISSALDRMKYDSQDGTFLSQKAMKHYSVTEISPDLKPTILEYAKRFEIEPEIFGLDKD